MLWLRIKLRRWAIQLALQHPPPACNDQQVEDKPNDYYLVTLEDFVSGERMRVLELLPYGLKTVMPKAGQCEELRHVPIDMTLGMACEYVHYYRSSDVVERSDARFIFAYFTFGTQRKRFAAMIDQYFFNRAPLVRHERMKVLRHIFERTVKNSGFQASPVGLASSIYSNRWVLHPDQNAAQQYYELILQSLVASGDLRPC